MDFVQMPNNYAIILAGGHGTRVGHETPKQFLNINNKPLIIHTLKQFSHTRINGIIIVVPVEHIEYTNKLVKEFAIQKVIKIIKGGETRQGSSYNAIKCMDFIDNDVLIFHDAARPFIEPEMIDMCIDEAELSGAAGLYIKVTDTIALVENNFIQQVPDRNKLYYTQTPQAFLYKIVKKAHELALSKEIKNPTDDIQLVLNAGYKVKIVEGNSRNIKITNAFDLELAEFIAGRVQK